MNKKAILRQMIINSPMQYLRTHDIDIMAASIPMGCAYRRKQEFVHEGILEALTEEAGQLIYPGTPEGVYRVVGWKPKEEPKKDLFEWGRAA